MPDATLGDICALACAEAFRGAGRDMVSPMAPIPKLGAKLAKTTFAPDVSLTDGVCTIVDLDDQPIGWMPFERVFDVLWSGRRHVMMGATQIDRLGNQNISCIGDHAQPKVQLLGARGAPGNTVHHLTSYWVPKHGPRVLVEAVDFISGVSPARGGFGLGRVVTNLCVLAYDRSVGGLVVASLHPGVTADQVREATGFDVPIPGEPLVTPTPTAAQIAVLDRFDPDRRIRGRVAA